jgi:hypothetical protein
MIVVNAADARVTVRVALEVAHAFAVIKDTI